MAKKDIRTESIDFIRNNLLAIATAFIALMALFLSVFHGCSMIKHHQLSLRPILTFNVESKPLESLGELGIFLNNDGIGPAIIKKFVIVVNGEKMTTNDSSHGGWIPAKKILFNDCKDKIITGWLSTNLCLTANEKTLILGYHKSDHNDELNEILLEVAKKVDIQVEYESLYGVKYKIKLRECYNP